MLLIVTLQLLFSLSAFARTTGPLGSSGQAQQADNCTLLPRGRGLDDSGAIATIFERCGKDGGVVRFPPPYVYTIGSRLETYVSNATIELEGTFQFTPNLTYWLNNSFPIDLQRQASAWRFHGENFVLTGGEKRTGTIDGNGQVWYSYSKGGSNTPGRPMSLDVYGAKNGAIRNFNIRQPQFWAIIVEGSQNITLENVEVFAENTDPAANGTNWVQNTDGLDTYRSDNITVRNFTYTGGDDCIAFKGNSSNVLLEDITCNGGPGIAFGSIGQYPGKPDYLTNITIKRATITKPQYDGVGLGQGINAGVYFKSWIGEEVGTPPNGGGGGTGLVKNAHIEDVQVNGVDLALYITSCLSYKLAIEPGQDPLKYCNTSTLPYEDLHFSRFSGRTSGRFGALVAQFNCSKEAPCENLAFQKLDVAPGGNSTGTSPECACQNVKDVTGIQCPYKVE